MNFYARLCDFLTNILTLKKILKYFFTFSFNDILDAFRVKVLYISVFQYSGDRKNIDNHLLKPFFDMTNHRGLRPTNLSKLKFSSSIHLCVAFVVTLVVSVFLVFMVFLLLLLDILVVFVFVFLFFLAFVALFRFLETFVDLTVLAFLAFF